MRERAETPLDDPQGKLERALIEEYLQQKGSSLKTIQEKPPAERDALLAAAAHYADLRLAEIDARAAYVHDLHGRGESS